MTQRIALVTGASAGLGRAVARALVVGNWRVVGTARDGTRLSGLTDELGDGFVPIAGDVTDPVHRARIRETVPRLDLVINNASRLGPSPLPRLADYPLDELRLVYETNIVAPLAILQWALPLLRVAGGAAVNISSDAAVGAYEGWGGYGSAKAALDHATAILAAENPDVSIYALDPGDMRTAMHQAAFPGEDISDRPEPETVVPAVLALIDRRPPSGRYLAADLLAGAGG